MKYDVNLFASTRVRVNGVDAGSQAAAIEATLATVDLDTLLSTGNLRNMHGADVVAFADEVDMALVDEVGDAEYSRSRFHKLVVNARCPDQAVKAVYDSIDAIEIHKCAEIYDSVSDSLYSEQVDEYEQDEDIPMGRDEILNKVYWSVFGHLKTGGLVDLCDCETKTNAEVVAFAMKELL
jgi:hypothetical protein